MKKVVTLKALKNKGRMSVETAFEVLSPKVHQVIPTQNIVTTIVSEIYTFWHQNRPGANRDLTQAGRQRDDGGY